VPIPKLARNSGAVTDAATPRALAKAARGLPRVRAGHAIDFAGREARTIQQHLKLEVGPSIGLGRRALS
jgi:hypothetical protein